MKLTPEQLKQYDDDPWSMEKEIRELFNIPEDRYFTVSTYPANVAGNVRVDMTRHRVVKPKKISKSDQQ